MQPNISPEIRESAEASQQTLTAFQAGIAKHIAAIQAAGREFLTHQAEGQAPREIRVEITAGPDPSADPSPLRSIDCWDEDIICGTSSTGYIHCTIHICMEVGPITVKPG
jgi:hypothetical protein